ncbi:B3 domain-containing transcription factor VRN1-like [Primulina eburnea]|uniref:B3 domain-containing transcription factor VRN1-like n=1 Tax=Primulina eburnea TaxID=1245227 RepID=UPI003C6C6EFC
MTKDYNPKKGDDSGSNRSSSKGKAPRFFKIVPDTGIDRLSLPTEFTRRYGHNLPDCISLKVPSGLVWKVGLVHYNHEIWLHRGWQRFQEYYSLRRGNFLFFKYVENFLFEVNIFDTSGTEIEYFQYDFLNSVAGLNHVDKTERVESESDDSVLFLEEILTRRNAGIKDQDVADDTNNSPSRWRKKRRMQESDDLHAEQKLRKSSRGEQNTSCPIKRESRFVASSPNYRSVIDEGIEGTELKYSHRKQVQHQARDAKTRFKAYIRASAFMSEKANRKYPFVIVEMHPSYASIQCPSLVIHQRIVLKYPVAFNKELMLPDRKNSSILVCEGKTWPVNCIRGKEKATLTTGWRNFVQDNDIKVGDACVLEVVERINLTINVIIFRG